MKFSTYYRIQNRDKFLDRFMRKQMKNLNESIRETLYEKNSELMELIVRMILEEDKENLKCVLSKNNAKGARTFFDYFEGTKIKSKRKADIEAAIDEIFSRETNMKDFQDYLCEKVKPIKLSSFKFEKFKLNEADDEADMGGDPFADDGGGDDAGGDDPFGGSDDAGGDDGDGGDAEGGEGDEEGTEEDGEEEGSEELDMSQYEDDPDFTEGVEDSDNVALSDTPAGESIYDTEGIMTSLKAVIETLPDYQLAEIEQVKKDVTLIFNGKKLKAEDVTFKNPKNASFLLRKIADNVDEKTGNYLIVKIKEPLLVQRDKQKEEIAAMKNDTAAIRDTISNLDK